MRYRAHHIGRVRIRAAKILADNFPMWDVRPDDISPATGRNRTDWRSDIYRWEIFTRTKTGLPVVLGSWDTLTRFIKLASKHGCFEHDGEIHIGKPGKD